MARDLRRLFRSEDGVTEVIGYVLSFALSAIFLLLALNVFWASRGNTEDVTTGVELKTIADRVAGRIVEFGLVSQEFGNVTSNTTIVVPQMLNGRVYTVTATDKNVTASTIDGLLTAISTNFRLEAIDGLDVNGMVDSSNERIILNHERLPGGTRQITINGE